MAVVMRSLAEPASGAKFRWHEPGFFLGLTPVMCGVFDTVLIKASRFEQLVMRGSPIGRRTLLELGPFCHYPRPSDEMAIEGEGLLANARQKQDNDWPTSKSSDWRWA